MTSTLPNLSREATRFNTIEREATLANSFIVANRTLIPKPEQQERDYIPISMTNADAKTLNKTLASIYPWHAGWFNICKIINFIHHIKLKNKNHMIISTD